MSVSNEEVTETIVGVMSWLREQHVSEFMFTHDAESSFPEVEAFITANPRVASLDQITTALVDGNYQTPMAFHRAVNEYFNTWIRWITSLMGQFDDQATQTHWEMLMRMVKYTQRQFKNRWDKCVILTAEHELNNIRKLKAKFMSLLDHPLDLRKDDQFVGVMGKELDEIEGIDPGQYPDGSI